MALRFLAVQCISNNHRSIASRRKSRGFALEGRFPLSRRMRSHRKTQEIDAILLSLNGDFADIVTYPPKNYRGIVALQMRNHPETLPHLMKRLSAYLVRARRSTDLEVFDALTKGASSEAREVLERFRDNHALDPEKILATELHIELDQDFHPIEDSGDGERTAQYEGTLDLVLVHSLKEAEIDDWKSYYQIIDADTFQSKFYPLLLMCLNPSLEKVKFVLEFVRYGASRCVEYTRKDVPWFKELAHRERARQKRLHELATAGERDLKASPGRHCTWCPLLSKGCPVAKTNPYSQMTAEERVRFALWLQEAEKQNTKVLKNLMVECGPIHYCDGNQTKYVADFVPVEKKFYPYDVAVGILDEWFRAHPDEQGLQDKLTVSGLSSVLKAQKRSELAQKLTNVADVRVDTELRIALATKAK